MKKKKNGLIKRIAAGVCAVVVAASCVVGSVPYYAEEASVSAEEWFCNNKEYYLYSEEVNLTFPDISSNYPYHRVYYTTFGGSPHYVLYCTSVPRELWGYETFFDSSIVDKKEYDRLYQLFTGARDLRFGSLDGVTWVENENATVPSFISYYLLGDTYVSELDNYDTRLVYSNYDVVGGNSGLLFLNGYSIDSFDKPETYNSSLGYLQNVRKKDLTLDGENYDPDYDSWTVMYTFDSKTTTGLDVTSGGYSVRHYTGYEIYDRDSNVVRSYDPVLSGEYDAAACKLSYPLYSTRQDAMDACGFEPLSWWEDSVLGYEHYIYDYLQLVRTNADGSVEYGGYVKISEAGEVSTTLSDDFSVDSGGYVDKEVPESSGSGSNYEDAEHDADENASNAADSNIEFTEQMNDMVSMVSAVPQLFGALFSFLPDWCLNLLAAGVGFGVILLIWKAARG